MVGHNIIVIGGSWGGVEAMREIVRNLPADLPAAVLVVIHTSPTSPGYLPEILNRAGPLPAAHAVHGEKIKPGRIYVAPPDHHLLVSDSHTCVVRGPKENRHRPAVDPLFRTAAQLYGPRVVGVILTGGLDDGTAGLLEIKAKGGVAVVQDPHEAEAPSMPQNALRCVKADYCLPLAEIAPLLVRLALDPVEVSVPRSAHSQMQATKLEEVTLMANAENLGRPSIFTCPECHGLLYEQAEKGLLRFCCRVGHAFSAHNLLAGQSEALEDALWAVLNLVEERAALSQLLAKQETESSSKYVGQAQSAQQQAALLRQMLVGDGEWYSAADL